MSSSRKLKAVQERHMEEELVEKEDEASSTMKLAMDTLDRGLEAVRVTHRTAKRLRESVSAMASTPRLVPMKK